MGKPGKSRKTLDWVALMDELWNSDDENSTTNQESVNHKKTAPSLFMSVETCEQEEGIAPSNSGSEHNNTSKSEQFQLETFSKAVDNSLCLSEDPLSDTCHSGSGSSQQSQSPVLDTRDKGLTARVDCGSCQTRKIRQTDLLSFIDQNYSQTNTDPLSDMQNLQSFISTDDGYTTLENSRLEYTPQQSLPMAENKANIPRVLFSQRTTKRRVRKRKESESARAAKRPKVQGKENEEQLYLDLGQKNFGHVTCKVCGMMYTCGQPIDDAEHLHFHKNYLSGVNFPGWKKEHIVDMFPDGRIVMVLPSDPKLHRRKVEEIKKIVDFELGYASGVSVTAKEYKAFLYISSHKRVMGCLIAEAITQGYQVLSDSGGKEGTLTEISAASWLCSTDPEPAQLGINRLWVSSTYRRKGVASKLLDAARSNFTTGYVVPRSRVAFSDPTPDGIAFAANYSKTPNFLVYSWLT